MLAVDSPKPEFFSRTTTSGNGSTQHDLHKLICQPQLDYTKESERLKSYINWPNKELDPVKLAKAGFYYIGVGDIVRCAFCSTEGYHWSKTDDPMADHSSWKPSCSFVRKLRRNSESSDQSSPVGSLGHDTCGRECIEIFPKSIADDELVELEKFGANKTKGPRHKEHCLYENRLKSFSNWPKSLRQKPTDLAEAGFFYRGTGDQTLCFYCGGGLNDWEESDEPWEQHAMWFPRCNYLLMKKGQEFVDKVRSQAQPSELLSTSSSNEEAKELVKSESSSVSPKEDVPSEPETSANGSGDSRLCKICYKNEMCVVFLPCGHIVACVDCASALTNCAVCRKKVGATVRAFLS